MECKQFIALAWKEYRQLRSVFIGITVGVMAILWVASLIDSNKRDYRIIVETFYSIFLFTSAILAFFTGAGARLLDSAERLEKFLHLRPIEIINLLTNYFLLGIAGWIVWVTLMVAVQIFFYGFELFNPGSITPIAVNADLIAMKGYPWEMYGISALLYLEFYTIAFCAGNLLHRFSLCIGACSAAYIVVIYIMIHNTHHFMFLILDLFFIPIPVLLLGTYFIYRRMELGRR